MCGFGVIEKHSVSDLTPFWSGRRQSFLMGRSGQVWHAVRFTAYFSLLKTFKSSYIGSKCRVTDGIWNSLSVMAR